MTRKSLMLLVLAILSVMFVALWLAGCSSLHHYKLATHPGQKDDASAGDITHAQEPGARVVVPKKAPDGHASVKKP